MNKRNLVLAVVVLVILAGGAGYYFWNKKGTLSTPGASSGEEAVSRESGSFLDTFFEKLKPSNESKEQLGLKEYKDPAGIFSIQYPSSWVMHNEQGQLLKGVSLTPPDLLSKYSSEEQQFVKGLVIAATESSATPQDYYESLVGGSNTGQTEFKNLTINGYPAYMVKGNVNGVSYTIYIVSHNNRIVYFNYRSKEDESAHQNDIRKAIDFGPYLTDFEAAVNSIKFSN